MIDEMCALASNFTVRTSFQLYKNIRRDFAALCCLILVRRTFKSVYKMNTSDKVGECT